MDSLKPHFTENDVSTDIEVNKGIVDLSCTRFKTRIRKSDSQVRSTLRILPRVISDWWSGLVWSDGDILRDYSTSDSGLIKAKLKDT